MLVAGATRLNSGTQHKPSAEVLLPDMRMHAALGDVQRLSVFSDSVSHHLAIVAIGA